MAQIFKIAPSSRIDNLFVVGEKSKVSKELFWQTVESKVREVTKNKPDKYDEVLATCKDALSRSNLTILDTWFDVKGRP